MKEIYLKNVNETIHTFEINKLKVNVLIKKNFSSKYSSLTVKYGSNDIKFDLNGNTILYPLGIAHFLEHKLFEQKEFNIFNEFSKHGGSPNAFTNNNVTSYYFNCTNNFNDNLKLLLKLVFEPHFTQENVEKEKGIIEQEIKMYEDNHNFKVYDNILRCLYINHPVREDIAGTVESIHEITKDLLYENYNYFYTPENMVLTIVGDVDLNNILEILKDYIPKKEKYNVKKINHVESLDINSAYIEKKMDISIPTGIIGLKVNPEYFKDYFNFKAGINTICRILFDRSSNLHKKLYDSGLINDMLSFGLTLEEDYGNLLIAMESKDPKSVNELIIEEIEKIKLSKFNEDDVLRQKKSIAGNYMYIFDNIQGIGGLLRDCSIKNLSVSDYYDSIKNINNTYIENIFNDVFKEKNMALSVVK